MDITKYYTVLLIILLTPLSLFATDMGTSSREKYLAILSSSLYELTTAKELQEWPAIDLAALKTTYGDKGAELLKKMYPPDVWSNIMEYCEPYQEVDLACGVSIRKLVIVWQGDIRGNTQYAVRALLARSQQETEDKATHFIEIDMFPYRNKLRVGAPIKASETDAVRCNHKHTAHGVLNTSAVGYGAALKELEQKRNAVFLLAHQDTAWETDIPMLEPEPVGEQEPGTYDIYTANVVDWDAKKGSTKLCITMPNETYYKVVRALGLSRKWNDKVRTYATSDKMRQLKSNNRRILAESKDNLDAIKSHRYDI